MSPGTAVPKCCSHPSIVFAPQKVQEECAAPGMLPAPIPSWLPWDSSGSWPTWAPRFWQEPSESTQQRGVCGAALSTAGLQAPIIFRDSKLDFLRLSCFQGLQFILFTPLLLLRAGAVLGTLHLKHKGMAT